MTATIHQDSEKGFESPVKQTSSKMTHFMGHNHNRIFLTARIQQNEAVNVVFQSSMKCKSKM
jgi:hypothetical protein